jgi:hypothetical protein
MDNSAFQVCDVGVGVIHNSIKPENLKCAYFVDFELVASFFEELLANNLIFDPKFSTIRPSRQSERR